MIPLETHWFSKKSKLYIIQHFIMTYYFQDNTYCINKTIIATMIMDDRDSK